MTIKREQMQARLLFAECEEFVRSQNDEQPIPPTVMSTNVETSLRFIFSVICNFVIGRKWKALNR